MLSVWRVGTAAAAIVLFVMVLVRNKAAIKEEMFPVRLFRGAALSLNFSGAWLFASKGRHSAALNLLYRGCGLVLVS